MEEVTGDYWKGKETEREKNKLPAKKNRSKREQKVKVIKNNLGMREKPKKKKEKSGERKWREKMFQRLNDKSPPPFFFFLN